MAKSFGAELGCTWAWNLGREGSIPSGFTISAILIGVPRRPQAKKSPGPDAERLVIEGDWRDAVKRAVGVKRPTDGWPKPEPKAKKAERPKKGPRKRS
jgi:hypothetical protein